MEGLNLFESNILLWIQDNLRTDALDFLMPHVSAVNNAGLLSMLTVILLIAPAKYDVLIGMFTGVLAYKVISVYRLKKN